MCFCTLPPAKVEIVGGSDRNAQKWEVHNHILKGKNPDQQILFFHGENVFSKFETENVWGFFEKSTFINLHITYKSLIKCRFF